MINGKAAPLVEKSYKPPETHSLQARAYALWKWGKRYPDIFPHALEQARQYYAKDRRLRGIE